jgi:hypothetical protein
VDVVAIAAAATCPVYMYYYFVITLLVRNNILLTGAWVIDLLKLYRLFDCFCGSGAQATIFK